MLLCGGETLLNSLAFWDISVELKSEIKWAGNYTRPKLFGYLPVYCEKDPNQLDMDMYFYI